MFLKVEAGWKKKKPKEPNVFYKSVYKINLNK